MRLAFASFLVMAWSAMAPAAPLIVDNGRLFVQATLDGAATEALLDSGAETSLVDPALAARAKLPPGLEVEIEGSGSEKARFVYGATIAANGITLKDQELVILDLGEFSKRMIKRPTQLVIGRQLFDAGRLRINIEDGTWDVLDPDAKPAGIALKLEKHAGIEAAPVMVNGIAALADLDLGNGSKVMVSKVLATKLGLKVIGQETGGGIRGDLVRDLVMLDTLEVAGQTFRNVEAGVHPLENAGDLNIGTSILRHFILTTDFAGKTVYLAARAAK